MDAIPGLPVVEFAAATISPGGDEIMVPQAGLGAGNVKLPDPVEPVSAVVDGEIDIVISRCVTVGEI